MTEENVLFDDRDLGKRYVFYLDGGIRFTGTILSFHVNGLGKRSGDIIIDEVKLGKTRIDQSKIQLVAVTTWGEEI